MNEQSGREQRLGEGRLLLRARWTLAIMALLTASCGVWPLGPRACTEMGCSSGLTIGGSVDVEPGARFTAELCIDGTCMSGRGRAAVQDKFNAWVGMEFEGSEQFVVEVFDGDVHVEWRPEDVSSLADGRPREVSLTMRTSGRQIVESHQTVQFRPTWPNGKECDPEPCWEGAIRGLTAD